MVIFLHNIKDLFNHELSINRLGKASKICYENMMNNSSLFILSLFISLFSSAEALASKCIAHRGYSSQFLENSLEAINEAIRVGSDGVEFDIRFTQDDIAVLMHDATLEKTVMARSADHNCPLKLGVRDFNYQFLNENCVLKNGENIPLLRDVLDEINGYDGYVFFDLKEYPSDKFFELLKEKNIRDSETIRFMSFEKKILKHVKRKRPSAHTLLISKFFPRGLFHTGINVNQRSRNLLFFFRWIGKEVGVWTSNSRTEITRALNKKVTFITTDYPERCLKLKR